MNQNQPYNHFIEISLSEILWSIVSLFICTSPDTGSHFQGQEWSRWCCLDVQLNKLFHTGMNHTLWHPMFPNTWQELPRKWARSSPFLYAPGNLVRSRSLLSATWPWLSCTRYKQALAYFDPGNTHKNAVLKLRQNSKKVSQILAWRPLCNWIYQIKLTNSANLLVIILHIQNGQDGKLLKMLGCEQYIYLI